MSKVETKFTIEILKYAGRCGTAGRLTNACLMKTSEMSLLPSDVVQWKERPHCETSVYAPHGADKTALFQWRNMNLQG